MPRNSGRNRTGGAGAATATPPPVAPVPAPLPVPIVASEDEKPKSRSGGLGSYGIARLEREVAEFPDRFRIIDIPLDDIVESPYNPTHRQEPNEEELADILPSVREFGVMSAVLVCERAELVRNSPKLDQLTKRGQYVMVAGHRRKAASRLAGRDTVPAVVRNEFATARALNQIRLAENGGRLQLTPLEEAEGYQLLVDDGMSYQQIVDTVGGAVRSKGQVAKRLKLLQLTPLGRDLLNRQEITVDGALTLLSKLPEAGSQDRALKAATAGPQGERLSLKAAIEQESRRLELEGAVASARQQIAEMGLEEIDPTGRWGDAAWLHRLATENEVEIARAAGDLAGAAVVDGRIQYFRKSASPTASGAKAEKVKSSTATDTPADLEAARLAHEQRQAHYDASAARKDACRRMVNEFSEFRDSRRQALIEILAEAVLTGSTDKAVLRRPEVAEWTGSQIATEYDLGEVIRDNRAEANRLAFATALAVLEAQAADDKYLGDRPWPPAVQRYVRRLAELGYHSLTAYEEKKLA